jgi:hypothetical protein
LEPNVFIKNVQFLGGMQDDNNKKAAVIQIDYIQRIINNNRIDVTGEERRHPVIFDKPCKNFIEMEISITTGRDSARWLSGGNFDFKTNTGSGYIVQLRYPDYDGPIKEAIAIIRGMGFTCYPGKKSTTCFLAGREPDCEGQARLLRDMAETVTSKMKGLIR